MHSWFSASNIQRRMFLMGFREDDREYIATIQEASCWGSKLFLRKLFITMLLTGSVNRPGHVLVKTDFFSSDGIHHHQRMVAKKEYETS